VGQHSFIIFIYVIFGQPGECADTKVQIEAPLNENMDMRSAVHRALFLEISPKITTFMATFLGQPVRRSSRLVIFSWSYLKSRVFQTRSGDLQNPKLRISEEIISYHLSCPLKESDTNPVHQCINFDGRHLTGAVLRVTPL
jgi:hypothetical protein